jgi:hypothetical protein
MRCDHRWSWEKTPAPIVQCFLSFFPAIIDIFAAAGPRESKIKLNQATNSTIEDETCCYTPRHIVHWKFSRNVPKVSHACKVHSQLENRVCVWKHYRWYKSDSGRVFADHFLNLK